MSITVKPTETVPFAHGDDGSLHCVIASNGHVWGKFLDGESGRKDVELAVYAPTRDGYLWRTNIYRNNHWFDAASSVEFKDYLTKSQQEKIALIMRQESDLAKLLGCVHLPPAISSIGDYWREENRNRAPHFSLYLGGSHSGKAIDCSFMRQCDDESYHSFFKISYDDIACAFLIKAGEHTLTFRSSEEFGQWTANVSTVSHRCAEIATSRGEALQFEFCAAQANKKTFDFYWTTLYKKELSPRMRSVLYRGFNIFDFFAIDDALLLAEAIVSGEQMTIGWTVAVAQNKHVRHLRRLCSNNPDLLLPASNDPSLLIR